MNQKESEDNKAIAAVGSKRSHMTRSPYWNATASQVQDGLTVSPQQKNQHVADTNTAISFRVLADYTRVQIDMLLSPLTAGITTAANECHFDLVIFNLTQKKCVVTFARAEVATMAANELNAKALTIITGILSDIITYAAPAPVSMENIEKSL